MLINGVTIDLMIQLYIVGLFALILICLYALIQSKANKLYTFIIIPLALLIASMTWQGIKMLQGMPVYGLPMETQVQVMFVHDSKPWIYVLLNSENGPKFYKIDWSEENKKKMKDLQKQIGSGSADGKFKEGNPGESKSFFFTPMMDMGGFQRKEPEESRDSEVTYENNVTTGNGPGYPTNPDRPSLEVDNDEETSFTRGDGVTIPWSTQLLFPEHKETFIGPLNEGEK